MRKKFGNILLEEGIIDKAQLEDALRIQREQGGRLGSILVQLGYIDVDTLAKILKEQLNIESVSPQDIENLSYEVINSIPRDIVEEFLVLPVKVSDREIEVAMLDPKNTEIISELSFFLDKEIVPLIIPEGLLYQALKKYYNIDVSPEEVIEVIEEPETVSISQVTAPPTPPAPPPPGYPESTPVSPHDKEVSPTSETTPPPMVIEEAEEVVEEQPLEEVSIPPEISSLEKEDKPEEPEIPVVNQEESVVEEWVPTPPPGEKMSEEDILASRNLDDLVYKIAQVLSSKANRNLIFKIHKDTAFGWVGKGEGITPSIIDILMVPLCVPSIFKTACDTGETFFGPPPLDDPFVERVMKALNSYVAPPKNIVLTPVKLKNRSVFLLYVDNGPSSEITDLKILPEINRVAEIAAEAVEKIITDKKKKF